MMGDHGGEIFCTFVAWPAPLACLRNKTAEEIRLRQSLFLKSSRNLESRMNLNHWSGLNLSKSILGEEDEGMGFPKPIKYVQLYVVALTHICNKIEIDTTTCGPITRKRIIRVPSLLVASCWLLLATTS